MAVDLNYRYFGGQGKTPLIILHGLLGSSRNWATVGPSLSHAFEVFAVDLRNHGESPHSDEMTYQAMVEDLLGFMEKRELKSAVIMGHSLGGKVAMLFSVQHPQLTEALIVVDIAPKDYPLHHEKAFDALLQLDLDSIQSRKDADEQLAHSIEDWAMRQFLLTNLKRDKAGAFYWTINVLGLSHALRAMSQTPLSDRQRYLGPSHFIVGENSGYFKKDDEQTVKRYFARSFVSSIGRAGHNPHIDNQAEFLESIHRFILESAVEH